MKTAIQMAIETIQSSLNSYKEILTNEPYNAFIAGRCAEKQGVIDYLTELLPTEKEQKEQAYSAGSLNKTENILLGKTKVTAEQYFKHTYIQTKQ